MVYKELISLDLPVPAPPVTMTKGGEGGVEIMCEFLRLDVEEVDC